MNLGKSRPVEEASEGMPKGLPVCYHCGETCQAGIYRFDEKVFCCDGCKLVYEILRDKDLCTYYTLDDAPGISPGKNAYPGQYDFLDDEHAMRQLIRFNDKSEAHVTFFIPGMHCSSCIWLLENLHRLSSDVFSSTVDFPRKEVNIVYHPGKLKLSSLAMLLSKIGYPPSVSLSDMEHRQERKHRRTRVLKLGLAGFCFGNIMMLSFPEYFALGDLGADARLGKFFSSLNLILSIPVVFYCASEFFVSAWKGIRQRFLNIDAPIALAILVTFARSIYEILSGAGAGYLDSMSGIVFFMLAGRFFQDRTYDTLSFDRDYKSYFPLGTTVVDKDGIESRKLVSKLGKSERIRIRNQELVPADALLMSHSTHVDYSFITGESAPVHKVAGELIYAGARQLDGAADLEIVNTTSQSYLTQLWNRASKDKVKRTEKHKLVNITNKYFTLAVMIVAFSASIFWSLESAERAIDAFTAVLIVACPCGLLLTSVFVNGNVMRIMGRNGLYMKNSDVIEKLGDIDAVVLDKTGTITLGSEIEFNGRNSGLDDIRLVVSLAAQSSHPLSRRLAEEYKEIERCEVFDFREYTGHGISGTVKGRRVKLGSVYFIHSRNISAYTGSRIYVSIDGVPCGYFSFCNHYRPGLEELVKDFGDKHVTVLSGDNDAEYTKLREIFGKDTRLLFNRKPAEKEEYITALQCLDMKVMMLGDGLNDAAALRQSDIGIAVTDDTNTFSPACSAILDGKSLPRLRKLMNLAHASRRIILFTFLVSLVYNVTGLYFAVQGDLSPLVAAILMPLSSISIVVLATSCTNMAARLRKL